MDVVLVAGTHGYRDPVAWHRPGSLFVFSLVSAGLHLLDNQDPFEWSTNLGRHGRHDPWIVGADALRWYLAAKRARLELYPARPTVAIIAYSHGGQVAAYALAGLRPGIVDTLITVATPVRTDMVETYICARGAVRRWIHLHSDLTDQWQAAGSGSDDGTFTGQMSEADENVYEPVTDHHSLLSPKLWFERSWWDVLMERCTP